MVKPKKKRRTSGSLIAWVSVGAVVALVATFVLVKELDGSQNQKTEFGQASMQVFDQVTKVPLRVYNAVGITSPTIQVSPPEVLTHQPAYTVAGMPGVIYYGAEFCPYCAATRWGIITALARFGTFNHLNKMWSSATDPAGPNIPTFTFYKVKYTSKYFHLGAYEVEDRNGKPLMSLPNSVNSLVVHYNPSETFPFMDMGNKVFITEAAYDPLTLEGYTTQESIASQLDNPSSPVTQAIISTANYISAGLCAIAKDPPASVCSSPGVQAAAHALKLTLP